MNVVFHLGSAIAVIALVWALLGLRRERDLLRLLIRAGMSPEAKGPAPARVVVDAPRRWLAAAAAALGVAFEAEDGGGAGGDQPARIEPEPFVEMFLVRGLTLVRWKASEKSVELHVAKPAAGDDAALAARLSRALGGAVAVSLRAPASDGKGLR